VKRKKERWIKRDISRRKSGVDSNRKIVAASFGPKEKLFRTKGKKIERRHAKPKREVGKYIAASFKGTFRQQLAKRGN